MANELRVSASLTFTKAPAAAVTMTLSATNFTVSGTKSVRAVQAIGTSAEALGLGEIAAPGYYFCKNLDATNFVELLTATGGTVFAKLKPGEVQMGRFGAAVTAPAAKADTAACNLEYLIVED